jgi:hypothetical protein
MPINIDELNTWIETDEGKQWADILKSGLMNKNNELLAAIHKSDADMAGISQRLTEAEGNLENERAYIKSVIVDQALEALLNDRHYFKTIIPHCIETIKNAYGVNVRADGAGRSAVGTVKDAEGNDKQISLSECFEHFDNIPENHDMCPPRNSGGGAPGGGSYYGGTNTMSTDGRELAKLSDAQFEALRQQTLRGNT